MLGQQFERDTKQLRETALLLSSCRRQLDKLAVAIACYQRQYPGESVPQHGLAFTANELEALAAEERGLSIVDANIADWMGRMEQHCLRRVHLGIAIALALLKKHPDTVCALQSVIPSRTN